VQKHLHILLLSRTDLSGYAVHGAVPGRNAM